MNDKMTTLRPFTVRSIRLKFAAVMVVMAAVLIVTCGVVSVGLSYKALREQKQKDELVIARSIAIQVSEALTKARSAVEALATMPAILSMDPDRQIDALTVVTQTTELIDGIIITDAAGRVRAVDGEINTDRIMLPASELQALVKRARSERVSFISDVYPSKTSEICVSINAPILRDGLFIGLVSVGILLRNHSMGGIDSIRIGDTGYAYVVDSTGDVVLHPHREREFENFSHNPAVRALLESRTEGVIEFASNDGLQILAAYAPVIDIGWGVIVRQPTDESYALADHIRNTLWIVLWSSIAGAMALGFFLGNRILRPITALAHGAKRIGQGDLTIVIEPESNDEVGELAKTFNQMTTSLRERLLETERAHKQVLETNSQLSRSERLASVGQMAAGLAHEINNPINIIMGFSDLLLKRMNRTDPMRSLVEEIDREINRCQRLVQNLLDLSRQRPSETQVFDIFALLKENVSLIKEQARNRRISISFPETMPPAFVRGDTDQLRQVLLNILLNAIQAMPDGGELTVGLKTENNRHIVRVSDTGPGIPADILEKIFDPFFTTKETGTGLGLAVSHAIVERHNGSIEVSCPPEGGTDFNVILPKQEGLLVKK